MSWCRRLTDDGGKSRHPGRLAKEILEGRGLCCASKSHLVPGRLHLPQTPEIISSRAAEAKIVAASLRNLTALLVVRHSHASLVAVLITG